MFSLFPSDWQAPKPKDVDKNGNFMPKEPVPVRNARNDACMHTNVCPAEEMLRPGEEVDVSEIDAMLVRIGMAESGRQGTSEINQDQVVAMIDNVNAHLKKNIETLKSANPYDGDTVTREDLIKLLEMFVNYSKTLESYFKSKTH